MNIPRSLAVAGVLLAALNAGVHSQDRTSQDRPAIQHVSNGPRLTVEETVGSIFSLRQPGKLLKRANPDAKPIIWKIIDNPEFRKKYHSTAIQALTYIGDESDVLRLRNYLKRDTKLCLNGEATGIKQVPLTLGHMATRGVPGAKELLLEMVSRRYWDSLPQEENTVAPKTVEWRKHELMQMSILGLALGGEEDLKPYIDGALVGVSTAPRVKYFEYYLDPENVRRSVEFQTRSPDVPIGAAVEAAREAFNGDLDNPGPRPIQKQRVALDSIYLHTSGSPNVPRKGNIVNGLNVTGKLTADERAQLEKEAVEAYRRITTEFLDDKLPVTRSVASVLDSGRWRGGMKVHVFGAVPPRSYEWYERPGFDQRLDRIREILRKLGELDPQPADFEFWSDTIELHPGTQVWPNLELGRIEVLTVMFRLQGTENVKVEAGRDHPTRQEDGSLVVLLKKVDDQWYWNPFGW